MKDWHLLKVGYGGWTAVGDAMPAGQPVTLPLRDSRPSLGVIMIFG